MIGVNVWWGYLAPQNIPSAIVLTFGNKVVLLPQGSHHSHVMWYRHLVYQCQCTGVYFAIKQFLGIQVPLHFGHEWISVNSTVETGTFPRHPLIQYYTCALYILFSLTFSQKIYFAPGSGTKLSCYFTISALGLTKILCTSTWFHLSI